MTGNSFSAVIVDSLKNGLMVDGIRVEPLSMHASGVGQVQLLDMDFGVELAKGVNKLLFYTFTSELTVDENLEDFQDFVKLTYRREVRLPLLPQ
jgi:hypothetical protein